MMVHVLTKPQIEKKAQLFGILELAPFPPVYPIYFSTSYSSPQNLYQTQISCQNSAIVLRLRIQYWNLQLSRDPWSFLVGICHTNQGLTPVHPVAMCSWFTCRPVDRACLRCKVSWFLQCDCQIAGIILSVSFNWTFALLPFKSWQFVQICGSYSRKFELRHCCWGLKWDRCGE